MDYNSKYRSSEIEALLDKVKNLGGDKTAVVNHGTADTEILLTPNMIHKWDVIDSLSLTFPLDEDGYTSQYKVVFTAATSEFTLSLPYYVQWVNAELPTFEEGKQYEMSIEGCRVLWAKYDKEIKTGIIEYVENDGVDYIMTDIVLDSKIYGMRHKSMPLFEPGGASSVALAGTRSASGQANTIFTMWYRGSTSDRRVYWDGKSTTFDAYVKGGIYEDELANKQLTQVCDYPLAVFAQNASGSPDYKGKLRLYYLQLLDYNNNVVVDLRPYRMKPSGAVGLYDMVSGKFYESVNGNLMGSRS